MDHCGISEVLNRQNTWRWHGRGHQRWSVWIVRRRNWKHNHARHIAIKTTHKIFYQTSSDYCKKNIEGLHSRWKKTSKDFQRSSNCFSTLKLSAWNTNFIIRLTSTNLYSNKEMYPPIVLISSNTNAINLLGSNPSLTWAAAKIMKAAILNTTRVQSWKQMCTAGMLYSLWSVI